MAKTVNPRKNSILYLAVRGVYSHLFYKMIYLANRSSNSSQYVSPLHNVLHALVW